jgi:divalent metal cation (Fe/Co/Zn/Cd) transporter
VSAVKILTDTVGVLMDRAALPGQEIEALAMSLPGVESVERVRSRGRSDETYVDLHVRVQPDTPVEEAHSIAHAVQDRIRSAFPQAIDVTIHIEPEDGSQPEEEEIARKLQSIAHSLGAAVHEIWKHSVNGHYEVELHVEVPANLSLEEAHGLATQLEERGRAAISNVNTITTHIEPMGETVEMSIELEDDTVTRLKHNAQTVADSICGEGACHNFRLRTEPGGLALSMHCALPSQLSIVDAHQTSEKVKEAVLQELPQLSRVTVHVEPLERG